MFTDELCIIHNASYTEADIITEVPLSKLKQFSCFRERVWEYPGHNITKRDVRIAIKNKKYQSEPLNDLVEYSQLRNFHIERLAYLVENDLEPKIDIDVGVPVLNCFVNWIIVDGNHRLGAAFYRRDKTIKAYVNGSVDYAKELGIL